MGYEMKIDVKMLFSTKYREMCPGDSFQVPDFAAVWLKTTEGAVRLDTGTAVTTFRPDDVVFPIKCRIVYDFEG